MSIQILMPALSPTMEEGKLAKWLVKEGDEIHSGDVLAEIETDKATMEFEAVDEGRIGKLLVPAGTEGVKVNQPIAELLQDGEAPGKPELGLRASSPAPPHAKKPSSAANQGGGRVQANELRPKQAGEDARGPRQSVQAPETAIPKGTEFVTITVREALRDAMAEEMRRDPDVAEMYTDILAEKYPYTPEGEK